jgi:hypothetical protein
MKKTFLLIAVFTIAYFCLSAQTAKPTIHKTPFKTVKPAAPKDTSLCSKNWGLTLIEEFGVESKPTKTQADDYLWMSGKGSFKLKRDGMEKSGIWTRNGAFIFFTTGDAAKEKFNYKVESAEEKKLQVDYHVGDIHTLYTFELR